MPSRHVSSGDTARQRDFLRPLAGLTLFFGLFFGALNLWLGDSGLAVLELVLSTISVGTLIAIKRRVLFDAAKWAFLLACLGVILFALVNAPSASVFIWALLVPPVGHRLLGPWVGSLISLGFLSIAAVLLVSRFGIDQLLSEPRPAADIVCFSMVLFLTSLIYERDLRTADHELRERADLDAVTRLATRSRFQEMFEQARTAARQDHSDASRSVSTILIDLDHFKQVNDTYGHLAGDIVLAAVSKRLLGQCRSQDILGRVGGEELAVMLFGVTHEIAIDQAERLRRCIADSPIATEPASVTITASLGVTTRDLANVTFDELFEETDKRLYAAKTAGRNRVQSEPAG